MKNIKKYIATLGITALTMGIVIGYNSMQVQAATTIVQPILGDVDHQGSVTLKDASQVLRYALNIEKADIYEDFLADYNGNGKVELDDAREVLRTSLKIQEEKVVDAHQWKKDREGDTYVILEEGEDEIIKEGCHWIDYYEELDDYIEYCSNPEPLELLMMYKETMKSELVLPVGDGTASFLNIEEMRKGIVICKAPIHTNKREDVDYKILGNKSNTLMYVEERNPMEGGKKYYLVTMFGLSGYEEDLNRQIYETYVKDISQ